MTEVQVEPAQNGYTVLVKIALNGKKHAVFAKTERGQRLRANIEHLVAELLRAPDPARSVKQLAGQLSANQSPARGDAPERTKQPQNTIQVHASAELHKAISECADGRAFAVAARELFQRGLDSLEERLWSESSSRVLSEYEAASGSFEDGETKQWSLRLSRATYVRASLIAQEYGWSKSKLAAACISTAIEATVTA